MRVRSSYTVPLAAVPDFVEFVKTKKAAEIG